MNELTAQATGAWQTPQLGTGAWDTPAVADASLLLAEALQRQEQLWKRGEPILVESLLAAWPELRSRPDALLELVYNEVILREEAGETPELSDLQQRFPELAEALRIQLEVDAALASRRTLRSQRGPGAAKPSQRQRIGRYEIQSVLGKGGMGIAYKAWDPKLKRVVALKMLRTGDTADEGELARFRTEAEAIARVHHENIVQVYDVGEQDGQPYFAMEYCAGGSLADKLKGTPLPPTEAAALLMQIASGVAAAHHQQIVHRDLKPANILISDCGLRIADSNTAADNSTQATEKTTGSTAPQSEIPHPKSAIAKVTDFGLAKKLDDDDGQTRSGAVMGTPAYMAPEQAFGETKQVGPAADIYALGALLYECLTGRPPFKGATMADTLDQVRHREPVPVRQFQPKVPIDLETIAMKCLQKESAKRYPTAEALVEELRRYQEGRPILARPIGPMQRAWRWCRRNPAVAGLLATVLLVLTAGAVVASIGWLRSAQNYRSMEAEKKKADENFKEAEVNLHETFRAVHDSFVAIGTDSLLGQPNMLELRTQLLAKSRPFFVGFVEKRRHDPKWMKELAFATANLAQLSQLLDSREQAIASWREAVGQFVALHRADPTNAEYRLELGLCLVSLGYQEKENHQLAEAEQTLTTALMHLRATPSSVHRGYSLLSAQANCLSYLGQLATARQDAPRARELHAEALQVQRRAVESFKSNFAVFELGTLMFNRGRTLLDTGDIAAAEVEFLNAAQIFEQLAETPCREQLNAQRSLASTASMLGVTHAADSRLPRATAFAAGEQMLLKAKTMWDTLAAQHPTVLNYQTGRADVQYQLAKLLLNASRLDDAEKWARSALKLRETLQKQHSESYLLINDVFASYRQLAMLHNARLGLAEKEEDEDRHAASVIEWLGKALEFALAHQDCQEFSTDLLPLAVEASCRRARLLGEASKLDEALKEWDRAVSLAQGRERQGFERERQALSEKKRQR